MMTPLDWSYMQSFAAVAEHGSLSAAARSLQHSQPTLSRHIAALEDRLDTRLFERSREGMILTETGLQLRGYASLMADAAAQFVSASTATQSQQGGTVRITASQFVATFLLPEVLRRLRKAHPEIDIEIVASDTTENLLRREADIALRMYRPSQLDVISKRLGNLEVGVFAAHSYVARRGLPSDFAQLAKHDVIGYDRNTQIIDGMRALGHKVSKDFFAFRCDDQVVCWQMVLAGCGIGFGQLALGEADPRLVRLLSDTPIASLPVWLTAHPELKRNMCIRRVYDWLASDLLP